MRGGSGQILRAVRALFGLRRTAVREVCAHGGAVNGMQNTRGGPLLWRTHSRGPKSVSPCAAAAAAPRWRRLHCHSCCFSGGCTTLLSAVSWHGSRHMAGPMNRPSRQVHLALSAVTPASAPALADRQLPAHSAWRPCLQFQLPPVGRQPSTVHASTVHHGLIFYCCELRKRQLNRIKELRYELQIY